MNCWCRLCGEKLPEHSTYEFSEVPKITEEGETSIRIYKCNACGLHQIVSPKIPFVEIPPMSYYHNVLEHFDDIHKFIQELPDGILTLTVPNVDFILKEKCWCEFTPIHLSYFTKETLTYAFEKNYILVLGCYPINNGQDLEIRVKRPKIVVWGAGHRTLTWLAWNKWLKPEYVVDSNPEKQGKFTPITHYPIKHPITLLTEKVDMLIVAVPGKYPEQVLERVREMDLDLQVRVL